MNIDINSLLHIKDLIDNFESTIYADDWMIEENEEKESIVAK